MHTVDSNIKTKATCESSLKSSKDQIMDKNIGYLESYRLTSNIKIF